MASPASIGTTLLDAAGGNGPTYFGERDAIKLAFNDTGTVLRRQDLATQTAAVSVSNPPPGSSAFTIGSAYTLGSLPTLAVPNTLAVGARDSGKTFNVSAVAVNAT